MSITQILGNKDLNNAEKLDQVATIIAGAREAYGNSDVTIPEIKVETTHGKLPFAHLENDSKVAILMNEALDIKAKAIADSENCAGMVLNKRVAELLATNALFANVSSGTKFEYL